MKPDRNNYEIWLVDYFDGNLDDEQVRQLSEFLDANPDLKADLHGPVFCSLSPAETSFRNKDNLRKKPSDLTESQFDLLCVSSCENDLSENQEKELEEIILNDAARRKKYDQFKKIRLVPPSLTYRNKSSLKKLTPVQRFVRYSAIGVSVAATVLVAVTIIRQPVPVVQLNQNPAVAENKINSGAAVNNTAAVNKEVKTENAIYRDLPVALNNVPRNISGTDSVLPEVIINRDVVFKITAVRDFEAGSLSDHNSLVAMNFASVEPMPAEELSGLGSFITRVFREKINKSDSTATGRLKAYEIADAGINGLNRLLGWEMTLAENRDENGELLSLSFNSKLIKFNAPVKKTASSE